MPRLMSRLTSSFRHAAALWLPATMVLALPGAVLAQDAGTVSEYQLPPAPKATTRASGPVIPEAPFVRSAEPKAEPTATTPSPGGSASPTASPMASAPARPAPGTARTTPTGRRLAPTPRPLAGSPPAGLVQAAAPATPTATATPSDSADVAATVPVTPPASAMPTPTATTARAVAIDPALVAGGAAGILAFAMAGWFIARRRRWRGKMADELAAPALQADAPVAPPASQPSPAASPAPLPGGPITLGVALDAQKISLSFMNARLTYRLLLTNPGGMATGPLVVAGDMISAHASIGQEEQLRPAPGALPVLHAIADIAPGSVQELAGDIVLPLAQVRALTRGRAAMLVPLVRFQIGTEAGRAATRIFVVGEPGTASTRVQPIRLDLGPRPVSPLAQAEVRAD